MKQKYKNYIKLFIDIIVLFTSIISMIISISFNKNEGYNLLFLLPITFLMLYFLIYRKILFKNLRIFLTSFSIIAYIRYIAMPILIVVSGYYDGRSVVSPAESSYRSACLLMIYEFIVVSVAVIIFEKKYNNKYIENKNEIELPKNKMIYLIFIGIAIIVAIIYPQALKMFSFINPGISGEDVYLTTLPTNIAIATYILFTGKYLIYILVISYLYKKYKVNRNAIYKGLAFLATFINISIFYGLNRSDLVIPACASILLYIKLFKDKNVFKYIIIGILVISLVSSIGETRQLASISKNQSKLVDVTDMVQGYFGGVYNVAISIETYDYYPESRSLYRVIYDTARPFIGINLFLKNVDMEFTNDFFNRRIYFSDHTAQIIPIIGQGYIHFGYILSPILEILIIYMAYFLEKLMKKTSRIELIYLIYICLIRMGFIMGQNTGNMANELSMNLVLFIIIYIINNKIVYKKEEKYD